MFHQVIFYLNKNPTTSQWVRSRQERELQDILTVETKIVVETYIGRSIGLDAEIREIDTLPKELEHTEHTLLVNLCGGCDLDGIIGPSLTSVLKKKQVRFAAPSAEFIVVTIDKCRLRECLSFSRMPIQLYAVLDVQNERNLDHMSFPLVLNSADSYARYGEIVRNHAELEKQLHKIWKESPLVLVEEYVPHITFSICVYRSIFKAHNDVPQAAIELAQKTYIALRGNWPTFVYVAKDIKTGRFFVEDVTCVGTFAELGRTFGLDDALQYLNLVLHNF
jgi:hypothetical protein